MKKTETHLRRALILSIFLTAAACGQNSSLPIALKPVPPTPRNGSAVPGGSTLLDEVVKQGVPRTLATLAFSKYDTFSSRVNNSAYLSIIDFTLYSGKPRLYMIDTASGHVDALLVAHGSGSDPGASGTPQKFSNVPDSKMSSLGAYLISEKFQSTNHGTAARLDGLESTNSLARDRAIILHSATYVSTNLAKMGMSWGCPAVSLAWIPTVLSRLSGGSFMYAYGKSQPAPLDEMRIQQIMFNPAYQWTNESEAAPVDGEF